MSRARHIKIPGGLEDPPGRQAERLTMETKVLYHREAQFARGDLDDDGIDADQRLRPCGGTVWL